MISARTPTSPRISTTPRALVLLFHTLNIFNGLWTLPVQLLAGLTWAYNAVVLFSFAIGGLGTYLLARQTLPTRSRWPAWLAGVVFTFAPYHFAHLLGHMQLFSLEWIPFYVLYLIRAVEGGADFRGAQRLRTSALAAFFLLLVGLCDWYYVLYCAAFTLIYLLYLLSVRRLSFIWRP